VKSSGQMENPTILSVRFPFVISLKLTHEIAKGTAPTIQAYRVVRRKPNRPDGRVIAHGRKEPFFVFVWK